MKKNKRQRLRLKPLATVQTQAASAGKERTGLRWLGWLGGLGMVALIGYLAFHEQQLIEEAHPTVGAHTNNGGIAQNLPSSRSSPLAASAAPTNRPGAVKNREAEGRADDLNNMGVHLIDGGDPAKAVPVLEKSVTLKPDDETFHFNLAVAYMKSGDSTNAEHEYKEALRLLPDYPEAHHNYGNLLARAGRLDEAEQHLGEAANEMPESAPFNNSLGVLRQRLKKTNEALFSFQKAVECDTNFAEAHFNLAQEYLARQDREKAIVQFMEVLRIKPGFAPAKQALARITSAP